MKKLSFAFLLLLWCCDPLSAQQYNTAVGVRLGTEWGLSVQQRVAKNTTIEGIIQAGFKRPEAMFSVLAQQHYPFITKRFNTYFGAGPHIGWPSDDRSKPEFGENYRNPFGISFIGGIELNLFRLNLSWDIKPAINIIGGMRPVYLHTGVSLRYIVVKYTKPKKKGGINWRFWE